MVITTDQGREFNNNVNKEFEKQMRIEHRLTTAYHPQANGLDERFNQTMKNSIAKFSQDNKASWDINISEIVYAYNTSVQDSTKYTPFQAMYGRVARLPIDANTDKNEPVNKLNDNVLPESSDFDIIAIQRENMHTNIMKNIAKAQDKQSRDYDLKHGAGSSLNVGSTVLKKNFLRKRKRGGCLEFRWDGPFEYPNRLERGYINYKSKTAQRSLLIHNYLLQ